jgi:hypothetical protein
MVLGWRASCRLARRHVVGELNRKRNVVVPLGKAARRRGTRGAARPPCARCSTPLLAPSALRVAAPRNGRRAPNADSLVRATTAPASQTTPSGRRAAAATRFWPCSTTQPARCSTSPRAVLAVRAYSDTLRSAAARTTSTRYDCQVVESSTDVACSVRDHDESRSTHERQHIVAGLENTLHSDTSALPRMPSRVLPIEPHQLLVLESKEAPLAALEQPALARRHCTDRSKLAAATVVVQVAVAIAVARSPPRIVGCRRRRTWPSTPSGGAQARACRSASVHWRACAGSAVQSQTRTRTNSSRASATSTVRRRCSRRQRIRRHEHDVRRRARRHRQVGSAVPRFQSQTLSPSRDATTERRRDGSLFSTDGSHALGQRRHDAHDARQLHTADKIGRRRGANHRLAVTKRARAATVVAVGAYHVNAPSFTVAKHAWLANRHSAGNQPLRAAKHALLLLQRQETSGATRRARSSCRLVSARRRRSSADDVVAAAMPLPPRWLGRLSRVAVGRTAPRATRRCCSAAACRAGRWRRATQRPTRRPRRRRRET